MATRMLARRVFEVGVPAGQDKVMAGLWLPPGSVVHGVNGYLVCEGQDIQAARRTVCVGSCEGWVFNVDDIDTMTVMDTEFDIHVPKDTAATTMSLDTSVADGNPFYEPGQVTWEFVFPVGRQPQRVYQKRWMASLSGAVFRNQDPETPFDIQFIPGVQFPVRLNRPFRVEDPSLLCFAVAAPDTAQTSTTEALAAIAENEWGRLRYIDHVLESAMISLIGLTEAGAETPWDEATLLLKKILDPAMLEAQSGVFVATQWNVYGEIIFDFSVEGTMQKGLIHTGR